MKTEHILTLLVCGLGVFHGFFLGIYLLFKKNTKHISNKILGVLLLFFGLRISKSIFLYFTSDLDFVLITLGLSLILILGPLFYIYTKSYFQKDFKLERKLFIHSIPFIILLGLNIFSLVTKEFYLYFGIYAIYLHFFVYILTSFLWQNRYLKKNVEVTAIKRRWLIYIHIGIVFIWASYFIFLFSNFIPYILGSLIYSVTIYVLSIWAVSNKVLAVDEKKYQSSTLDTKKSTEIFNSLENYFQKEKVYLNPNLKLQMVASTLKVTSHSLSQSVNENCKQNFQQYLNSFRINEAKQKLSSSNHRNITISSIAYECGFNSISAFNTAFKKIVHQTPSQFRDSVKK